MFIYGKGDEEDCKNNNHNKYKYNNRYHCNLGEKIVGFSGVAHFNLRLLKSS
jgi:hypothetical protein